MASNFKCLAKFNLEGKKFADNLIFSVLRTRFTKTIYLRNNHPILILLFNNLLITEINFPTTYILSRAGLQINKYLTTNQNQSFKSAKLLTGIHDKEASFIMRSTLLIYICAHLHDSLLRYDRIYMIPSLYTANSSSIDLTFNSISIYIYTHQTLSFFLAVERDRN